MELKTFEEYLFGNVVKKATPNQARAKSLIENSINRNDFLNQIIRAVKITEVNANFFIEQVYDILIELIRAKMLIDGFIASGNYAHEAEVSYLRKLDFNEHNISLVNELRKFRNAVKYYGQRYSKEEAENSVKFLNSILPKLKKMIENEK